MMRRFMLGLGALLCIAIISGTNLCMYWLYERPPFSNSMRVIKNPTVFPGDNLLVEVKADIISTNCTVSVARSIVDSRGNVWPVEIETGKPFTKRTLKIPVPLVAAKGLAQYAARATWVCNPLQKWFPVVVDQPDMDFIIGGSLSQEVLPKQPLAVAAEGIAE